MTPPSPLLYESHLHTPLCGHAYGLPGEYAAAAERVGFKGIIVTCHAPMPDGYSAHIRMDIEEFDQYVGMVQEATEEWRGRVDVRLGLESEYVPGFEGWIAQLHQRAHFHYVLGSVHQHAGEYLQRFFRDDWVDFQRTYFRHLAEAAESGFYDAISHPDLVKNQNPAEWNRERVMDDILRTLDRIAKAGTAMELNTSGRNKAIREMNPGREILVEMCARNIPVVLGADAHEPRRVGDHYVEALRLLREVGYGEVSFFLDRKRQSVRIEAALASLSVPR